MDNWHQSSFQLVTFTPHEDLNKPGPAQVGAISKAQKLTKGLQYVKVVVSWGPFYEKKFFGQKVSQC